MTESDQSTLKKPKRFNRRQLELAGVELGEGYPQLIHLTCMSCGVSWSPDLGSGGHLPRGYWKCPNGCNSGAE